MAPSDIYKFNKYKVGNYATFTLDDGTTVEITDLGDTYQEKKTNPKNPLSTGYEYYKNVLILKGGGNYFYNNPIGAFIQYDQNGNVVNQKNYDDAYGFTVQNLIDKMNAEYQLNLNMPTKNLFVNRFVDDETNLPEYAIRVPISDMKYRYLLINGNNGSVILDVIGNYIE